MVQNNMPPDEFQGLSPVDMHNLTLRYFRREIAPLIFRHH